MKKLVIIGASGHGKVVVDIAEKNGYEEIAFLDDNGDIRTCAGYPIIGATREAGKYPDAVFFVAIGNAKIRAKVCRELEEKNLPIATLIHPNAVIARDVQVGAGTVIMAGAVINPGTVIGKGCIINTGATVDHDNVLGNYVHISVGSHTAGTVCVGDGTWIGVGAIVSNNISICGDCVIGAGATVVKNIEEAGIYVGVPARKQK